jgi:hypothetical protein
VEQVEWTASYQGGTQVKISHIFKGDEIYTRMETIATETKTEVRVGVEVAFPDLYRLQEELTEDELEDKMDDDEIRAERVDGERFKFDLWEKVKLTDEDILAQGAIKYSLETKKLADKTITLSNARNSKGKILFEQSKALHQPLKATWYPETPQSTFVIEIDD